MSKRKEKNLALAKRNINLEKWLLENYVGGMSETELLNLLKENGFSQDDIKYLVEAYYVPLAEVTEALKEYDAEGKYANPVKFVASLSAKYNISDNTSLRRIRAARLINGYLNSNPHVKFPQVEVYNKLVRDNIPEIIEANGEVAFYHTVDNDEYWNCLLKKDSEELEEVRRAETREEVKEELVDKLEVIRAMASYHGFALEDIIEGANLKREVKGSFSKRLVLERTYRRPKTDV